MIILDKKELKKLLETLKLFYDKKSGYNELDIVNIYTKENKLYFELANLYEFVSVYMENLNIESEFDISVKFEAFYDVIKGRDKTVILSMENGCLTLETAKNKTIFDTGSYKYQVKELGKYLGTHNVPVSIIKSTEGVVGDNGIMIACGENKITQIAYAAQENCMLFHKSNSESSKILYFVQMMRETVEKISKLFDGTFSLSVWENVVIAQNGNTMISYWNNIILAEQETLTNEVNTLPENVHSFMFTPGVIQAPKDYFASTVNIEYSFFEVDKQIFANFKVMDYGDSTKIYSFVAESIGLHDLDKRFSVWADVNVIAKHIPEEDFICMIEEHVITYDERNLNRIFTASLMEKKY